jgi:hypothetical protein
VNGEPGPIFIAGADRSGLGVLGELLDAHRSIAVSRRTYLWDLYHRRYGDLAVPANLERCVSAMLGHARIAELGVDRAELEAVLSDGPVTYGRLFAAVQEQRLHRTGASRWADKSHGCEAHAEAIFAEYPDARVLHVVRDPRDRYASQAGHRRSPRGGAASGTALWRWSVGLAARGAATRPDRYRVVRYEDLVARPAEVLDEVWRFVGVVPDPAVLAGRELHQRSVGRYRVDLGEREAALIESLAGRWLDRFGYLPSAPGDRSARARSVALDLPLGWARAAAWHGGRTVRGLRRPRPPGRRTISAQL